MLFDELEATFTFFIPNSFKSAPAVAGTFLRTNEEYEHMETDASFFKNAGSMLIVILAVLFVYAVLWGVQQPPITDNRKIKKKGVMKHKMPKKRSQLGQFAYNLLKFYLIHGLYINIFLAISTPLLFASFLQLTNISQVNTSTNNFSVTLAIGFIVAYAVQVIYFFRLVTANREKLYQDHCSLQEFESKLKNKTFRFRYLWIFLRVSKDSSVMLTFLYLIKKCFSCIFIISFNAHPYIGTGFLMGYSAALIVFTAKVKPFRQPMDNVRIIVNELAQILCMIAVYLIKSDNYSIPEQQSRTLVLVGAAMAITGVNLVYMFITEIISPFIQHGQDIQVASELNVDQKTVNSDEKKNQNNKLISPRPEDDEENAQFKHKKLAGSNVLQIQQIQQAILGNQAPGNGSIARNQVFPILEHQKIGAMEPTQMQTQLKTREGDDEANLERYFDAPNPQQEQGKLTELKKKEIRELSSQVQSIASNQNQKRGRQVLQPPYKHVNQKSDVSEEIRLENMFNDQ